MTMTCEQFRELSGAFALDALDPETADEARDHLRSCANHDEWAGLRAAALAYGMTGDEGAQPPPALRDRVLRSALGQAPVSAAHTAGSGRRWLAAGAVAAVVVLIAAGAFAVFDRDPEDSGSVEHTFATAAGIEVVFEARFGEPQAQVAFAGLDQLASGDRYQLWAIRGTEWIPAADFVPDGSGRWAGNVAFAFLPGDAICLTADGSGGPDGGPPLFVEPL